MINLDSPIFFIAANAFHTVVANFLRIKITPVTFSAPDTFTVVQNALLMQRHLHSSSGFC